MDPTVVLIVVVIAIAVIGIMYMSSSEPTPAATPAPVTAPAPASTPTTNSTPAPASSPPAKKFVEGGSYRCGNGPAGEGGVYRAENDVLRHYPSADIAASWDPNWTNFKEIDCEGLKFGDEMQQKA